jgi:F420-dependent oxidoreductase-like protein
MDHFYQIGNLGPAEHEMLEAYTTLGFAAGRTSRIKLGSLVTGVTYRYPGLLIKTVTTLDVLSGGRAYFGIGAAWNGQEHEGLGVPFPETKERFEWLEDTLQIAHQMWSGEDKPFDGKRAHLGRSLNSPQAITKPHPPILIGGTGEQKTLKFVAQYGDACNLFARMGDDILKRKLDILRGHCEKVGRPYEEIEKTSLDHIRLSRDGVKETLTPPQVVERFAHLAELGFDQGIISLSRPTDPEAFELLGAEVIPEVEKIRPAGR